MDLFTTVALPVVRGPVPVAKAMAAIDLLSQGRLTIAVGPGSSPDDCAAVGIDFSERWARLDESILALRALVPVARNTIDGSLMLSSGGCPGGVRRHDPVGCRGPGGSR